MPVLHPTVYEALAWILGCYSLAFTVDLKALWALSLLCFGANEARTPPAAPKKLSAALWG